MATNTTNYGLKKPAPSDFYNIADFNGNADIIDTQMKLNAGAAQNALEIGMGAASRAGNLEPKVTFTLTCTKAGKVHTLSYPDGAHLFPASGLVSCLFRAPADYAAGDSFKMGNTTYAIATSDGEELADKAFVLSSIVPVILDQTHHTINFKQAGRKLTLSAESYVMVQCFTANGTFVAPMTGKYRVTCIAKGGDGDDAHYDPAGYALNGAGGGAGGAASGTFSIKKGYSYTVTVNNAVSSFGLVESAAAGQKGVFNANQGGTSAAIAGGTAGTASTMGTDPKVYAGQGGDRGEAANMGKPAGGWNNSYGGTGGAYTSGQSKFLSTSGGQGGAYQLDGQSQRTTSMDGLPPDGNSPSGFAPFGAGGGGGMYRSGAGYLGGHGGSGAVIVELLLN